MRRMFSENQIKEMIEAKIQAEVVEKSKCQVTGYFTDEDDNQYVILPNIVENANEVKVNVLEVSDSVISEKTINFEDKTISAVNIGSASIQLVRIADGEILKEIDI